MLKRSKKYESGSQFKCTCTETPSDPDILQGNHMLRAIEVNELDRDIASSLQFFGPLSHLTALQTISLHLATNLDLAGVWSGRR
ncbi:hypothetical protein C8J57DRAFT_1497245 [Mycena rebaudengoi]|nr:hypothetical protein C8J57DRAFT_1497245 [Mycena rebaudengoi]